MPLRCRPRRAWAVAAALVAAMLGAALPVAMSADRPDAAADAARLPPPAGRTVDFAADVRPILATACYDCHGPAKQKGDYRLDVKSAALAGEAIVPGRSADSPLIRYVAGADDDTRMPPKGPPLSAEQVGILRAWIDQGARWPDDAEVATMPATRPTHWSLRPLARPPAPAPARANWARTQVDAFILAALEARNLVPSPEADRRTLIRRVTFDLTGLPPTPAEVDAFLADSSPDAYERVVDRLLASPRYGERWARHWMDVVHYAESHGHDEDKPRPNAWPYRDYLIRSFNDDKPYARFAAEQLAGDVLHPDDPQATVATAFVAVGPWDQSSQMGIQDGTVDKQMARVLDRDDMIWTTLSTFVSSTVHCARCHNHKFDPIPQADYYALQAVFAGVDRIDRPYDLDPAVHAERRRLRQERDDLAAGRTPRDRLLAAAQAKVAAWERAIAAAAPAVRWTVLDPAEFTSAGGATLTKQPDGSLLASGSLPEKDAYTITARTDLAGITAVRLEVLADDSLPHRGPGRQPDNGNLHLTEFRVTAAPAADPKAGRPVPITRATADFDQDGWDVAKAIDGKAETAWGIHPREGASHAAVFVLKAPLAAPTGNAGGGSVLTFTLEQAHGRKHLIGRPRLSVTTDPPPGPRPPPPPAPVAAALAVPPADRTDEHRSTLARHVLTLGVDRKLAALPPPAHVYGIASDFEPKGNYKPAKKPRPVHVLRRGDIRQPGAAAAPGALSCVTGPDARFRLPDPDGDEGARRAALAAWITHRDNVLTWRSIVNRVWHYHFGRGICDTPNDFGTMGAPPTHPELLDWLAVTFRDDLGGSFKRLHRLIVTSATYRQASAHVPAFARVDADARYLWRMPRARLDAEQVRDAVLAASGKLDLTMGGPSVRQFAERKGVHETPVVEYDKFDPDAPGSYRRAVYRFVFRTVPDPLFEALDCPDASQLAPKRDVSVTALQALAMMNDRFVVRQSEHLAARLAREAGDDPRRQVDLLYRLTLARPPAPDEAAVVAEYAARHGMANAARMVLNSNEFMFVD